MTDPDLREKVWQAVLFQDTFLTIILKLPPTATHTDVKVEGLGLEVEDSLTESGATGKHFPLIYFGLSTLNYDREPHELALSFELLMDLICFRKNGILNLDMF